MYLYNDLFEGERGKTMDLPSEMREKKCRLWKLLRGCKEKIIFVLVQLYKKRFLSNNISFEQVSMHFSLRPLLCAPGPKWPFNARGVVSPCFLILLILKIKNNILIYL
jgi:hypothetical protein